MRFEDSRPDRKKKAMRIAGVSRASTLESSPIPPAKSYEFMTFHEVNYSAIDRTFTFDVESYPNYFCVGFKDVDTSKVISFEDDDYGHRINGFPVSQNVWALQLGFMLHRFRLIGFYSRNYDIILCQIAVQGVRYPMLFEITDQIINNDAPLHEIERKYGGKIAGCNHIDLIEVAPLDGSLKLYAGRSHCERMQDLPYLPHTHLDPYQRAVVRDYNINDLDNTELLFRVLEPQIKLREQLGQDYGIDLRSRSDAQIAESVIVKELEKLGVVPKTPTIEPGWQFYYQPPEYVRFHTTQLQNVLETVKQTPFTVALNGSADCPSAIEALRPRLGRCIYRLGAGGLHSSEETVCHRATADTLLIDRDVASFYPYIILNNGFYPQHLGPAFLKVYRNIVDRRINAKREKNTVVADALKITINGTFGKLGNKYSRMYSPDLLIQVTMTGQLSLLMLIEMIELSGIPVVSANTDGIVIACPANRYSELEAVIMIWEEQTGFLTEETRYKGLFARDVNNYIAVKEEGGCKTKGVYSNKGSALNSPLSKNPETYICSMAVQAFLEHGTPIEETVEGCKDFRNFISVRKVQGGAEKDGVYLGKVIRWYYAKGIKGTINYVGSGNNVPKSKGAKPCMILPSEMPTDIDFDYYINEANKMLYEVGYFKKVQSRSLFNE